MENSLARSNMIKSQLQTCGIESERILDAVAEIRRENFVPSEYADTAYIDGDLPLGKGRYIVSCYVLCALLTEAKLLPTDKVLVVGGNLGYSSAVISKLVRHVTLAEERPDLVNKARQNLKQFSNIEVVTSPLASGCPNHQPYDVVIIEGMVEYIPEAILNQLAEGGSVVTIKKKTARLASDKGTGRIIHVGRQGDKYLEVCGIELNAPILHDFLKREEFVL